MKNERSDTEKHPEDGEQQTKTGYESTTLAIISRKEAQKKGLTKYYNGRLCCRGHRSQRWVNNHACCQCTAEKQAVKVRTEEHRVKKRRWDKSRYNWKQYMHIWKNCKNRAKDKGLPFDLDPEDITIPSHCPVLGIPLEVGPKGFHPNSPSVDRLDPSKGYVKDNIRVISMRANKIKSDATLEEMRAVLQYMEKEME